MDVKPALVNAVTQATYLPVGGLGEYLPLVYGIVHGGHRRPPLKNPSTEEASDASPINPGGSRVGRGIYSICCRTLHDCRLPPGDPTGLCTGKRDGRLPRYSQTGDFALEPRRCREAISAIDPDSCQIMTKQIKIDLGALGAIMGMRYTGGQFERPEDATRPYCGKLRCHI
ncbi:hypothetical protein IBTHAUMO2_1050032 [Nitrosopumilaceae archaeon]|nr:hypothetical protein IBTHAUMO2_1050032 [Nitrosopumilaceae archaeon]